ncbi:type II toxin-antitoxin system RelE/ParE family toxin [Arthrobacter sp. H5]|uniref:type II toxin-antitoxin system RelE family toxin n=1 Tax=Arthrobacter sp. H5 TaxID=1267973 RepID=UPI0004894982|nr:type II toxin-antitoxin system RelE/ParE family toxin [Arthrobacter sp. H5]
MTYSIRLAPKAAKHIQKLDPAVRKRIRIFLEDRLGKLENPRQLGTKLVNDEFWRYRIGDYRILTTIDDEQVLVLIVEVAHRREIYGKR